MLNLLIWDIIIGIRMDLELNPLQSLICHKILTKKQADEIIILQNLQTKNKYPADCPHRKIILTSRRQILTKLISMYKEKTLLR